MDVADAARCTHIGAHQPFLRPTAGKMFEQGEQGFFAVIEGDVIEKIEYLGFGKFAQFGVDPAPTEHGDDVRVLFLDAPGHAESGIDGAGERDREQDQLWHVFCQHTQQATLETRIDQARCCRQRSGEWRETPLALRQRFAVADEFETWITGIADDVCQVVEEQCCEMACPIMQAECAKGPGQRVAAAIVEIVIEGRKTRSFRQKAARHDALRQ